MGATEDMGSDSRFCAPGCAKSARELNTAVLEAPAPPSACQDVSECSEGEQCITATQPCTADRSARAAGAAAPACSRRS